MNPPRGLLAHTSIFTTTTNNKSIIIFPRANRLSVATSQLTPVTTLGNIRNALERKHHGVSVQTTEHFVCITWIARSDRGPLHHHHHLVLRCCSSHCHIRERDFERDPDSLLRTSYFSFDYTPKFLLPLFSGFLGTAQFSSEGAVGIGVHYVLFVSIPLCYRIGLSCVLPCLWPLEHQGFGPCFSFASA